MPTVMAVRISVMLCVFVVNAISAFHLKLIFNPAAASFWCVSWKTVERCNTRDMVLPRFSLHSFRVGRASPASGVARPKISVLVWESLRLCWELGGHFERHV